MIHQFKLNGYNIILDVCSGSVNLVDDVAYRIIQLFCGEGNGGICKVEGHPDEEEKGEIINTVIKEFAHVEDINHNEVKSIISDVEKLVKNKLLFTPDIYREKLCGAVKDISVIKALCLHVAHTCNLNCEYCFAAQGKFHGNSAVMSPDVAKKALDFLVKNSAGRKNLEVDFFGGEPLLNWQVVKETVAYGRELEKEYNKHFRFTLTTNGIGINEDVIDFANKEMDNVVLSLDGRPEVHDHFRKFLDGGGSYEEIIPKFKKLVESRGGNKYYIRGTFTGLNKDFTKDIIHMADLGFDQLSMEPVVCSPEESYALKEEDLPEIFSEYEKLAMEMLERRRAGNPFSFYHYMIDLKNGPCVHKRVAGCGSGCEYMAVTPWGDLYPCHQFVGDEDYKMGDIWSGISNVEKREAFSHCNIYSRSECEDCWAKLYCSGGCAANNYHSAGSIEGIYEYGCKVFKKRMECAIMLEVASQIENLDY
ncbi:thioether cross-link-forming SCIFF peptide maturase [Eubacteriales bacterium KG127]